MIPMERATAEVLEPVQTLPAEPVSTALARGSVLAHDLVATLDTPPFDASAMDGYAVRAADLSGPPVELAVVATSSSGHPTDVEVTPGNAVRILTGAVVPAGADAVVPVEGTDGGTDRVTVQRTAEVGENIRRRGEVGRSGELLVAARTQLTAGHLGVIASAGYTGVSVYRRPRVAIITTGDELVAPGGPRPGPGQIYDSNSTLTRQLVETAGGAAEVVRSDDDAAAIAELLNDLRDRVDLILTSGGISMGAEFDPMRAALAEYPVSFEQVAIKPAKPLAFGEVGAARYVGLPGNPVSVVVSFELFVRPVLRRMCGIEPATPARTAGRLGAELKVADDGKTHLVPVAATADGTWSAIRLAGSHALLGIAAAQALAVVAPDTRQIGAGSSVELIPLWR